MKHSVSKIFDKGNQAAEMNRDIQQQQQINNLQHTLCVS